ncbi:hypothetical protein PV04_03025 [Phialophora macrospora]|uniref:Uncharacterized protein n=1 Tax=Phialophora macrospora TaxID=1851006 RepID=A0A0D2GF20_9EURO|nr:hypothetical protein PV04_03025 [Phialophora macrospora]
MRRKIGLDIGGLPPPGKQDDLKVRQTPRAHNADNLEPSGLTDDLDWKRVSAWCQSFLRLPDSELNSLWYERLASAVDSQYGKADTIISLYQRAIEKENPSWLCYSCLAKAHFVQGWAQQAIAQPEAKDVVELRLLLAQYTYKSGDVQTAAEHYLVACKSEDPTQAKEGELGHLKARLGFTDPDGTRQLLKSTLATKDGEGGMASTLKMLARDVDHDALVSKTFNSTKGHPDLLRNIVRAVEVATAAPAPIEDPTAEPTDDDRFAEDQARGVLLYDRGVAAYTYNITSDGTDTVRKALRLWEDSRNLLSSVGGRNAFITRQDAGTALAKHYFQVMLDGKQLAQVGELASLTKDDYNDRSDSVGFLGVLYALYGKKEQAREALVPRIKRALQILSDDIPENDALGFSAIFKTLGHYQDFENAAIALSLMGQPDLVSEALCFEAKDITGDVVEGRDQVLEVVTRLAKETIQVAKRRFPDASQQIQRIEAARAHVESLVAAANMKTEPEASSSSSHTEAKESESQEGEQTVSDPGTAFAYRLLQSRLRDLRVDTDTFQLHWTCDGRDADGKRCENKADFDHEFYHCTYCSNRDFCHDCLARLRAPDSDIRACSAKHRWLRIPRQGEDMYVGTKAKSVPVPTKVQAVAGDERILEISYDGHKEIAVEAWKETLAREWDISLEEIKKEMSRQATYARRSRAGCPGRERGTSGTELRGGVTVSERL